MLIMLEFTFSPCFNKVLSAMEIDARRAAMVLVSRSYPQGGVVVCDVQK